jgi:hypothetical protein
MSKMKKLSETAERSAKIEKEGGHENFMGGISYSPSPLQKLKLVSASSIFGEPAYYRDGVKEKAYVKDLAFGPFDLFGDSLSGKKTSDVMLDAIKESLDADYAGTIAWAVELRKSFLMRLNPQIIMVMAATHPSRKEFDEKNPGVFLAAEAQVMSRADEPAAQFDSYVYLNKGKAKMPNVLKKAWSRKVESLSAYEIAKYKDEGSGIIDVVRVCHAHSALIDELMKTGTVKVKDGDKTWENLRSEGKSWEEILSTVKVGHMALLRNLVGIFTDDKGKLTHETAEKVLKDLVSGVPYGKQFPFRYWSAYKAVSDAGDFEMKPQVLSVLCECMKASVANLPHIKGRTMVLSDNSGSAWGAFNSEYGSVSIAEIDNLSALITALASDEGWVGVFGDRLKRVPAIPANGVMPQLESICSDGRGIGESTENGVWLFLDQAIKNKEHWDTIVIYSDQQAGHGGLYGVDASKYEPYRVNGNYIDVAKLVDVYRRTVNPKVNVVSVQTAGYDDVVVPEYGYRTTLLTGWTGREATFIDAASKLWDAFDTEAEAKKEQAKPKQ